MHLVGQAQQVLYISGHKINRAADGYRGEGKTDARDAAIIADQARMRRDLPELHIDDEVIAELRLLVARRQDLTGDRTRLINRLRAQLLGICPALERALHLVNQGPVVLLTGFQTPAAIRATGGDMDAFGTPDRLAAYGGLAPAARDSGQVSGNLHRPQRYNRTLQRVFFISAQISARYSPESKTFYERKRREGKRHNQAVLALARRRLNVLWALIRDHRRYQPAPPLANAA
ncbi:IS110 family transposase [Actinomadura physcomitrii]|uniref:IS110 family transposase n=1 Tax=Actinomadura physcomitrii TaxID=2650748 RepID=UPI002E26C619